MLSRSWAWETQDDVRRGPWADRGGSCHAVRFPASPRRDPLGLSQLAFSAQEAQRPRAMVPVLKINV